MGTQEFSPAEKSTTVSPGRRKGSRRWFTTPSSSCRVKWRPYEVYLHRQHRDSGMRPVRGILRQATGLLYEVYLDRQQGLGRTPINPSFPLRLSHMVVTNM